MKAIVLAAALAVVAPPAFAQSAMPGPSTGSPQSNSRAPARQVSPATRQFVQKAAITDLFEIETGQLAQQKAEDNAYKDFGNKIATDHRKTGEQLKSLAQGAGVQMPGELDSAHKQKLSRLEALSGARLETQFKAEQVQGHQQAVKLYQDYARSGDQPELKQFAQQTLPTLEEHLKDARALPKTGGAPTVGSGGRTHNMR